MKLSVYSNESLETIEKWVFELFSPITNLSISKRNMNLHPPAFEIDKNMKKFVEIVPIKDLDVLEFIWVINEDLHKYYRTKPDTVLGHLFGHEGPNSLLSLLKEEGLATALIQSTDIDLDNSASFGSNRIDKKRI
jgi:secreted Zn-dependent insulinase-like peptidase